jgi:hypothetical protein
MDRTKLDRFKAGECLFWSRVVSEQFLDIFVVDRIPQHAREIGVQCGCNFREIAKS